MAAKLNEMAVQQGYIHSMYRLGDMYQEGHGVKQSNETAVVLYLMAADCGHATAQCCLGFMYDNGYGVEESTEMAREWFTKAATQRHEIALNNLKAIDKKEGKTTPSFLFCSTCGKLETTHHKLKSCKKCHTTQYCNKGCQAQHWHHGGHKSDCKKECRKQNA